MSALEYWDARVLEAYAEIMKHERRRAIDLSPDYPYPALCGRLEAVLMRMAEDDITPRQYVERYLRRHTNVCQ